MNDFLLRLLILVVFVLLLSLPMIFEKRASKRQKSLLFAKGFSHCSQTRIDILDKPRSSNMRVQWQNPIGLSRTIVGNLSGYVEFYDEVGTGQWVGTLDTGLIYRVTPNSNSVQYYGKIASVSR